MEGSARLGQIELLGQLLLEVLACTLSLVPPQKSRSPESLLLDISCPGPNPDPDVFPFSAPISPRNGEAAAGELSENGGVTRDMIGAGRRFASQHRRLAGFVSEGPVYQRVFGTVPRPASNRGMPSPLSDAGGRMLVPHAKQQFPASAWDLSVTNAGGRKLVPPQARQNFCTSAGDPSVTDAGDNRGNADDKNKVHFRASSPSQRQTQLGNSKELRQKIASHIDDMKTKVLGFKEKYHKHIRSSLVSRCLVVPGVIEDPWTVFLHRQTFKIARQNPTYLSSFDVMAFESGKKDDAEWESFLNHLVKRKVYVIENWNLSFSCIEVLMYDHGLIGPDDGTGVPFYKGECDGSFDSVTQTASLSYILWKDGKIIYSEVFTGIKCSSSVEAEIFAACALLYKAEELKISELLVCSDCQTVVKILTGEQEIDMNHPHRDFYLMLRGMRSRFKWLVASWKPRELMVFVDDLAKAAKSAGIDSFPRSAIGNWSTHLRGLPVFRIERTFLSSKAVKKFGTVRLDDSYDCNDNSIYFIEVEEDYKFDCLVGLTQRLDPCEVRLFFSNYGGKSDSFKQKLRTLCRESSEYDGTCYKFDSKAVYPSIGSKRLVIVFDHSVPKEAYYKKDAFHVVLVTPSEKKSMTDELQPLTALGYVYFNEVRFPLNRPEKNGAGEEEMEK